MAAKVIHPHPLPTAFEGKFQRKESGICQSRPTSENGAAGFIPVRWKSLVQLSETTMIPLVVERV
jgi:hypothetical protein